MKALMIGVAEEDKPKPGEVRLINLIKQREDEERQKAEALLAKLGDPPEDTDAQE